MNEHFECPDEKRNTRAQKAFANGVQRAVSKVDFRRKPEQKCASAKSSAQFCGECLLDQC